MTYHNIPAELQALRQWVVWRLEETDDGKPTKVPYNARTGRLASHSDPSTWSTFDEAVAAVGFFSGIGFVFTKNDPYCGVDLDATDDPEIFARQLKIYNMLASYNEFSPSGTGLHIIVKASVPSGRKRAKIEVYSHERYFTFTGNVRVQAPIEERQDLIMRLWEEMGPAATDAYFAGSAERAMFDDDLIAMIRTTKNGGLFDQLYGGDWSNYSSQSEADQALMNIIAFHTDNRQQCIEIFRQSGLGKRAKAQRAGYMTYTVDKAFDLKLPQIDIDGVINEANAEIEARRQARERIAATVADQPAIEAYTPPSPGMVDGFDTDLWRHQTPPGLITSAAEFIYSQAPRPIREIALAGALGLVAGMAGRAYNVSATGLNQYLMMLAPTGRGKEAMQSGVSKILRGAANGDQFPALLDFLGPSNMASGNGLLKHLSERPTPCFVSITGEIGIRLQQMAQANANQADQQLRHSLLDLYTKSGAGEMVRPTVYSDKKNNIDIIHSPGFTWLGESTPEEFYKSLNESQIASGLLPRFTIIEYNGPRPADNEGHDRHRPQPHLLKAVQELGMNALSTMQNGQVINVAMTPSGVEAARHINAYADWRINNMQDGPLVQLWNRHHLKVLKTAALLAVGANPFSPLIDHHMVLWANSLIMTGSLQIIAKFEAGEVGEATTNDNAQIKKLIGAINKYAMGEVRSLDNTERARLQKMVMSRTQMSRMVLSHPAFANDKSTATGALSRTIKEFVGYGWLTPLNTAQAEELFGKSASRAEMYVINLNALPSS